MKLFKLMAGTAMAAALLIAGNAGIQEAYAESDTVTYADMKNIKFTYASGAGAWSSEFQVSENGTLRGNHHDTDMGDSSDGYDATIYVCNYKGQLSELSQIDEYTYSAKLESLKQDKQQETTWIEDRVRYIESYPVGINDTEEIYFYIPGTPKSAMPSSYEYQLGIIGMDVDVLTVYYAYNPKSGVWFFGNEMDEETQDDAESQNTATPTPVQNLSPLQQRLSQVEAQAAELEQKYQEAQDAGTRADIAGRLYSVWDDLLNEIWQSYSEQTKDNLRPAQIEWIRQKEATAQTISDTAGSVYYTAQTTKERVYYLMQFT